MIYYNVRLRRPNGMVVSVYVWADNDEHAAMQAKLGLMAVPHWIPRWLVSNDWVVTEVEPIGTP